MSTRARAATLSATAGVLLVVAAAVVPRLTGEDVRVHWPPLHAWWGPRLEPGIVAAVAVGALLVVVNGGLLLAPATVPWLWAVILGISGFAFPTAIALITARSRDPQVTARLSGFVQPVGYLLAAIGPFTVGLIHQATGNWTVVLILLMASGIPLTAAGLRLSARVFVDDEIRG